MSAPVEVERFRRNDYVGSPIWGFRGDVAEGDAVYVMVPRFDKPPLRVDGVVVRGSHPEQAHLLAFATVTARGVRHEGFFD